MELNLDDSLNVESSMVVDFENSDAVASQANHEMEMEFEHLEEQPILMDTGNEQIIDFMTENQFAMQEYVEQPNTVIIESNTAPHPVRKDTVALASPPREIAIAPKPAPGQKTILIQGKQVTIQKSPVAHQLPIAPKPVTILPMGDKKTASGGVIKGGPIYARIGDKLVMMPAGSQKFKLVTPGGNQVQYITGDPDLAQLKKVTIQPGTKTIQLSKVPTLTGQKVDSPAVITKVLPISAAKSPQTRIVTMTQKTVPISLANASVISPMKKILGKKDKLITIKTSKSFTTTPKLVPVVSSSQTPSMKKVVITSNSSQNIVVRKPNTNVLSEGNVINIQGHSQIHQVNVPGKGVQYIKLMNPTPPSGKTVVQVKAPPAGVKIPIVITDSKGQVIHVSADKFNAATGKVVSSSASSQVTTKPQTKFVRIAPLAKAATTVKAQPPRASQSLLAPLTPMEEPDAPEEEATEPLVLDCSEDPQDEVEIQEDTEESIQSVRAFLEAKSPEGVRNTEVEVEFERQVSPEVNETVNTTDQMDTSNRSDEAPLIVIPSNYSSLKQQHNDHMDYSMQNTSLEERTMLEGHSFNVYSSPNSYPNNTDNISNAEMDLAARARKPCNCTKSQCLKLYCDCFANGEFCNQCNCNNCMNNLDNEDVRQKAIRGTLERNPNAFRPKIGKAKAGGPEIRRHNKGCNCKRSGCLKNYCECFEAKIACTPICKCVGCRNVESLDIDRTRRAVYIKEKDEAYKRSRLDTQIPTQLPTSFMTGEVIEAVCQCLIASATETSPDPIRDVIEEFSKCLQDIVFASQQATLCEGPD